MDTVRYGTCDDKGTCTPKYLSPDSADRPTKLCDRSIQEKKIEMTQVSRSSSGWLVGVGLLVFEMVVEGSWVVVELGPFVHLESREQRKAGRRRREGI